MNSPSSDLSFLQVIDLLDVGPTRVEKRRVLTPYTVVQGGSTSTTDLIYTYDEDVFSPRDEDSLNLAHLITAQVALNYGLFCKEIRFHGPFSRADRRFLNDMMGNTAREIYVNKLLLPNPFLTGQAARTPVVKLDSYVQARVTFANPVYEPRRAGSAAAGWPMDPDKYTVMSSGGKESLLTFALLKELGREAHPVYINESGRHWYTALNAHRHFAATYPENARVWMNTDRVFNWMLRHFPFIRHDFNTLRADEYPVRLWTVAAFSLAAVPLMRKRGIGRLLIGDEYDTTRHYRHEGIFHYDGLFDQSLDFDNAFSRYFQRKHWNIQQFSIIRPLSELLVEKTLALRYPGLQQHQVSCHLSHIAGERVRPCGHCEKCRRVVGMLMATGVDPARCGYVPEQIERCLKALLHGHLRQEKDGAQHMAYLLAKRGLAPPGTGIEHPHVEKLRFDGRAPITGIPRDLRAPLYRIFLEHANGAMKRNGHRWVDFDPLTDPEIDQPYPFDEPAGAEQPMGG